MRARISIDSRPALFATLLGFSGCATGGVGPPALAYDLPDPPEATYGVADTVRVDIEALGQSLALEAKSLALYGLAFSRGEDGLRVRVDVRDLEAEVSAPLAGPVRVDESIVEGGIVLVLDRRGAATIVEAPEIEAVAAPFFAGPTVARSFFPGLPGRVAGAGDRWVDTVAYATEADGGGSSERSVIEYTVVGSANAAGRALLEIAFEGTTELRQAASVQGIGIEQTTSLAVRGRLLWDARRGLVRERETRSEGSGSVKIALAPAPLPTRVTMVQHVRLGEP